jgi:hypothetical protein
MPYERRLAEIGNSKWPPGGSFSLIYDTFQFNKFSNCVISYYNLDLSVPGIV